MINVVTKSGSNEFKGSLFEFYRDKSLNANSWANKTAVPPRAKSAYGFDQFGGSLGGPSAEAYTTGAAFSGCQVSYRFRSQA